MASVLLFGCVAMGKLGTAGRPNGCTVEHASGWTNEGHSATVRACRCKSPERNSWHVIVSLCQCKSQKPTSAVIQFCRSALWRHLESESSVCPWQPPYGSSNKGKHNSQGSWNLHSHHWSLTTIPIKNSQKHFPHFYKLFVGVVYREKFAESVKCLWKVLRIPEILRGNLWIQSCPILPLGIAHDHLPSI